MPAAISCGHSRRNCQHIRLTQPTLTAPVVLDTSHNLSVGFTTVTVCVEGRRGVFAMIAGALSRNRLNIWGTDLYLQGRVSSRYAVCENHRYTPVTDERVWARVEADLLAALTGERHFDAVVLSQRRYSVHERKFETFAQPPQVMIDNTISDSHTVFEVQTQDRLGLLYNRRVSYLNKGLISLWQKF